MARRAKASWVFLTLLARKALCSYHVLNFRMPEGLRSYKLCSYKKNKRVCHLKNLTNYWCGLKLHENSKFLTREIAD